MKIAYNVTGAARKELVKSVGKVLEIEPRYLGVPTVAYEVGAYHIDKAGTLTGEDNQELVQVLSTEFQIQPVSEEYDLEIAVATEPVEIELIEINEEQGGNIHQCTIKIPKTGFTEDKLENLDRLVASKALLLKAAFGTDSLEIGKVGDTLLFPWFEISEPTHAEAFTQFIHLLCKTAIEKQRVVKKESSLPENPKYAMRCFLLSLGFIGDEYKQSRKVLLSRLEGNSAFRSGQKRGNETDD